MKEKTLHDFCYVAKADYDRKVKIGGKEIPCYSPKKLAKLFPRGGYHCVGDIFFGNASGDVGFLEFDGAKLPISKTRTLKDKSLEDIGYIAIAESQFVVAVRKKTWLPLFIYTGIVLLLLISSVAFIGQKRQSISETPAFPEENDPNIIAVESNMFTISGTVFFENEIAEDAILSLCIGNTEVAKTSTDKSGNYLFSKVEKGLYTLSVSFGNATYSTQIVMEMGAIKQDFTLKNTMLSTRVEIADEKTPPIAVKNLPEIGEMYAVDGKRTEITFFAALLPKEEVSETDAGAIRELSQESELTFFDFKIICETLSLDGINERMQTITKTALPLEIIIPYNSTRDTATYVFRCHNSEVSKFTRLESRPEGQFSDGTYYVSNHYIYLYVDSFSTFAVGSVRAGFDTKGSDSITFSDKAFVNLRTEIVEMLYEHGADSSNNSVVEIYLGEDGGGLLIASSGAIPPGNRLDTMTLLSGVAERLRVGTFQGTMKIVYLTEGGQIATNVNIPLVVAISQ